jgi:hypothetical protein
MLSEMPRRNSFDAYASFDHLFGEALGELWQLAMANSNHRRAGRDGRLC